jgi:hypothetical protein
MGGIPINNENNYINFDSSKEIINIKNNSNNNLPNFNNIPGGNIGLMGLNNNLNNANNNMNNLNKNNSIYIHENNNIPKKEDKIDYDGRNNKNNIFNPYSENWDNKNAYRQEVY